MAARGSRGRKAKRKAARARGPRLASHVRPLEVALHVEVDPSHGAAFRGDVTHRLRLERPVRSIELHAADLRIARPRITAAGRLRRGALVAHPSVERVEITFAEPVPAGEAVLELAFAGKLRGDLRGLYAARAGERAYALTQLEAADARRFFPCFDEPSFKARFQLSVTTASATR